MSNCQGISGQIGCYLPIAFSVFRSSVFSAASNSAAGCSSDYIDPTDPNWLAKKITKVQENIHEEENYFDTVLGFQVGLTHESNHQRIELARNYITLAHLTNNQQCIQRAEDHLLIALNNVDLSRPGYVRYLPETALLMADIALFRGNLSDAEMYIETAMENREGSEMVRHQALFIEGQINERQGRINEARAIFTEIKEWSRIEADRCFFIHYWYMESRPGLQFLQAQSAMALFNLAVNEARQINRNDPDQNRQALRTQKFKEALFLLREVLEIDSARSVSEDNGFIMLGLETLILAMEVSIEQANTQTEAFQAMIDLPWPSIYDSPDLIRMLKIQVPGIGQDPPYQKIFNGLWRIRAFTPQFKARLAIIRAIFENQLSGGQPLFEPDETINNTNSNENSESNATAIIDPATIIERELCLGSTTGGSLK